MPHPNIMSVMVVDVDTSDDFLIELEKKVNNMFMKIIEERNYEITSLNNHIESRTLLNQVIHIPSRIMTKIKRQFCKKVNHKIQPQLNHWLFRSYRK